MKTIVLNVDDDDCAIELMESLRHEADRLLIEYPGTAQMIFRVADQIEKQIDDGLF